MSIETDKYIIYLLDTEYDVVYKDTMLPALYEVSYIQGIINDYLIDNSNDL